MDDAAWPDNVHAITLSSSSTVSFADVAHQTLIFDSADIVGNLVLRLVETRWMQRLRHIRQTGNTNLVYMYSEHSRFGHSLGVAYLSMLLMDRLLKISPEMVMPYRDAVACAAILHDVGHVAPGSHVAAKLWGRDTADDHEGISVRVIKEDAEISGILKSARKELPDLVSRILLDDSSLPPWTKSIISGAGWNADRGNWTIVDSAMCSVSYGRYNVLALIDAFSLSPDGHLVIQENRLDALTHFFVARESMYRQVYQHRVLQSADALMFSLIRRLRDLVVVSTKPYSGNPSPRNALEDLGIFCDDVMFSAITTNNYAHQLPLETIFKMTEGWWSYHTESWCECKDHILRDLAIRLRDRQLFKTIRLDLDKSAPCAPGECSEHPLLVRAREIASNLGLDPTYYVLSIQRADSHKEPSEQAPLVILDNNSIVSAAQVEPLINHLCTKRENPKRWMAVPKIVKEKLGRIR